MGKDLVFITEKDMFVMDILKKKFPNASNKTLKQYIKFHAISINGKLCTNSNSFIRSGSKIYISFGKRDTEIISDRIDLKIIYEDDDLIAIDKPSGLLSISNSKEKIRTAFRLVSDYIKRKNPKAKLFVVHRLDEQTSGVLLFSKNLKLKEEMQNCWNDIVMLREYYCIVSGKTPVEAEIKSYLTTNHFQIVHSTNDKERGYLAITKYCRIAYKNGYSLLCVHIETGRRNQIRVHLSEQGYPIVGDRKYGSKDNKYNRLALHATRLILKDPRNNKILDLNSQLPSNLVL